MAKFTHDESDQEFDIPDAWIGDANQVRIVGLGWWEQDENGEWLEIEDPDKPRNACIVPLPEGVEMFESEIEEDEDDGSTIEEE